MNVLKTCAAALIPALALASAPAMAGSFVTDGIQPYQQSNGIDYWGVQVGQFTTVDQELKFDLTSDSKLDFFIQGSPKFQFSNVLLNGKSIAQNFTVGTSLDLKASGIGTTGTNSLRFQADYTCKDCWGDWFGGYVQVSKAPVPSAPANGAVPEPTTWAMMIIGMGLIGAFMRRQRNQMRVRFVGTLA